MEALVIDLNVTGACPDWILMRGTKVMQLHRGLTCTIKFGCISLFFISFDVRSVENSCYLERGEICCDHLFAVFHHSK